MPEDLKPDDLEPQAFRLIHSYGLTFALQLSVAISLKRIADGLGNIDMTLANWSTKWQS